jgi:hypothetical protein
MKLNRPSLIVATVVVSESEIKKVIENFNADNYDTEKLKDILYQLGINTSEPVQRQDNLLHRNRLNEVVKCTRWLGNERQDTEWIESGYASREAKDKYSGNKILEDHYRMRMLTQDAQDILEERDRYSIIDESEWE